MIEKINFENYDTSINLLEGHFFITGAFYKAFLDNNFNSIEINNYRYVNGEFVLKSNSAFSFKYGVDSKNIPDLYEYENY